MLEFPLDMKSVTGERDLNSMLKILDSDENSEGKLLGSNNFITR